MLDARILISNYFIYTQLFIVHIPKWVESAILIYKSSILGFFNVQQPSISSHHHNSRGVRVLILLIDCDGTLLDSMQIWYYPTVEYPKTYNYNPTKEEMEYISHLTFEELCKHYSSKFIPYKSPDDIYKEISTIVSKKYIYSSKLKKGIREKLKELYLLNVKLILVSNTESRFIKLVFHRLKILQYFNEIYESKLYNKYDEKYWYELIKKLKINSSELILIDDSVDAITKAKSAGIWTIGVMDFPYNELSINELREKSDMLIESFSVLDSKSLDLIKGRDSI